MSKTVYTIGRDESCDICLYDSSNTISRYHAVLKIRGRGKYVIVDQSLNGTYINGVKIVPEKEVPVSRKDTVKFADNVTLDWSMIPDNRMIMRQILVISIIAVLALVLVVCLILGLNKHKSVFRDVEGPKMNLDYPVSAPKEQENEDADLDFIRELPVKDKKRETVDDKSSSDNRGGSENIDAIY